MLTSADVHVARALGRLGREDDERVLLAVALAVRAVRGGSVCPRPRDRRRPAPTCRGRAAAEWAAAVAASPLVAAGLVRWDNDLLYLDRYHEQESQVVDDLLSRAATQPGARPRPDGGLDGPAGRGDAAGPARHDYDEQVAACLAAAGQWTTVLTGGPGTGKTTAVASPARRPARPAPRRAADRARRADRQGGRAAAAGGAPGGRGVRRRPTGRGWPG